MRERFAAGAPWVLALLLAAGCGDSKPDFDVDPAALEPFLDGQTLQIEDSEIVLVAERVSRFKVTDVAYTADKGTAVVGVTFHYGGERADYDVEGVISCRIMPAKILKPIRFETAYVK